MPCGSIVGFLRGAGQAKTLLKLMKSGLSSLSWLLKCDGYTWPSCWSIQWQAEGPHQLAYRQDFLCLCRNWSSNSQLIHLMTQLRALKSVQIFLMRLKSRRPQFYSTKGLFCEAFCCVLKLWVSRRSATIAGGYQKDQDSREKKNIRRTVLDQSEESWFSSGREPESVDIAQNPREFYGDLT